MSDATTPTLLLSTAWLAFRYNRAQPSVFLSDMCVSLNERLYLVQLSNRVVQRGFGSATLNKHTNSPPCHPPSPDRALSEDKSRSSTDTRRAWRGYRFRCEILLLLLLLPSTQSCRMPVMGYLFRTVSAPRCCTAVATRTRRATGPEHVVGRPEARLGRGPERQRQDHDRQGGSVFAQPGGQHHVGRKLRSGTGWKGGAAGFSHVLSGDMQHFTRLYWLG